MNSSYGRFWGLLRKMGFSGKDAEEMKKELVSEYTGGRTESLTEMDFGEYDRMVKAMENMFGRSDEEMAMKKKRRGLLLAMQKLGICTAEWSVVDRFCMRPQIAGKRFKELTMDELDRVTRQVYKIIGNGRRETDNRRTQDA